MGWHSGVSAASTRLVPGRLTESVPRHNVHPTVLRLLTFGGLALVRDDASTAPRVRSPRLALLAALAVAGERGMSRERLMGFFWPDSDEARGRHSLRQALYVLRQELGRDAPELDAILAAIRRHRSGSAAARALGINRDVLVWQLRKAGLSMRRVLSQDSGGD